MLHLVHTPTTSRLPTRSTALMFEVYTHARFESEDETCVVGPYKSPVSIGTHAHEQVRFIYTYVAPSSVSYRPRLRVARRDLRLGAVWLDLRLATTAVRHHRCHALLVPRCLLHDPHTLPRLDWSRLALPHSERARHLRPLPRTCLAACTSCRPHQQDSFASSRPD